MRTLSTYFLVFITFSSFAQGRLTNDKISPTLKRMEYAVRGAVVLAADKINDDLQAKTGKDFAFQSILYTNIGNPHAVGQQPLTWPRQVLALVDLPDEVGVEHPEALRVFPTDAIRRAREIKMGLGGKGSGAYSHSKGVRLFRQDVASFIEKRDGGVSADPDDIFLSNGASASIERLLKAMIADSSCGVMIPIPQYPIYSACLDLLGGQKVRYYLDEENGWTLNVEELERSLKEAQQDGINVVGLVLINPGNPTGQNLSKEAVRDVVQFCSKNSIVLLSDEVYQENVYDDSEFYSAKRAAFDCGLLENDKIELASFHSISKGVFGECGRRGGYMELVGFDKEVIDQLYKLASSSLCSSISGQIMVSLMCRGPEPGDESFELHEAEKCAIFNSLKARARIVSEGLESIPGFSCQPAQGSMYCFPKVSLPSEAVRAAKEQGVSPDVMYALSLLKQTGICVVPASGFGHKEGRFGFRTTFLPSEEDVKRAIHDIEIHHKTFCSKYKNE